MSLGPAGEPRPVTTGGAEPQGSRIEVRGLRVMGTHGVLPEEHSRAQPFEVDLDVWVAMGPAGRSDDLADTVDYGRLVEAAVAVVGGAPCYRLLEGLAPAVGAAILGTDPRVEAVGVTVRKLRPPLAADVASTGVRVLCTRPGQHPLGPQTSLQGPALAETPSTPPVTPLVPTPPGSPAGRGGQGGRRRAFLGLGSNLGDRRAHLRGALGALEAGGGVVAVSPLYETEPVGGPGGQGPYLNLVVELETEESPQALLERCRALEEAAGRVRTVPHGPRTLDADVLLVGEEVVKSPELTVPHPRMWGRRFVLAPLADLAPELVPGVLLAAAGGEVQRVGRL